MENQENQKNQNPKPEQTQQSKSYLQQQKTAPIMGAKEKSGDNIFLKGVIVIGLILAMLLPTPFILNLISERKETKEKMLKKEGERFGADQTLYGPFLKVPYSVSDSTKKIQIYYVYISPKNVKINGNLDPVAKHRGLFDVLLYQAKLNIEADFDSDSFADLKDNNYNWSKAEIVFGVSSRKGLEESINFMINGKQFPSKIGKSIDIGEFTETIYNRDELEVLPTKPKYVDEIIVPISLDDKKNLAISIPLSLRGIGSLNFLSIAKNTQVKIDTPIKDLQFEGNESTISDTVKDKTRTLVWNVPSRNVKQVSENVVDFGGNKFGMKIIQPNDEYSKTNRVAKYSILFIGLTFVTFFFIEIINKLRIHPVQYVLVGLALSVFYLLLLSISEHIGFNKSYIISAVATVLLICWFIKGIVKKTKIMGVVFVVLVLLYAYIFVIIQLDDLALLSGSIGLFIILALLMHFSRKIEWKTE